MLQLLECFAIKFSLAIISSTLSLLDIFAYSGYKYVGLCLCICARLFGSTFAIVCALYTSAMLGYFFLKTLAAVVPPTGVVTVPPRHVLLIILAILELFISLLLNWL